MRTVCPVCHAPLNDTTTTAAPACTGCGRVYPDGNLTPVPPPSLDVRRRWKLWERLQANGAESYERDPPSSLSVGDRDDAREFGLFSNLQGAVLDVGCGPQPFPSYAHGFTGELVGIDPLRGEDREFEFVQAIGEYLPFEDDAFDRVLFATSLDHMLSPRRALLEARRVCRPDGGQVCLWIGELEKLSPRALMRAKWKRYRTREQVVLTPRMTMRFRIPWGAKDAFHFSHPTRRRVLVWMAHAGLTVREVRELPGGHVFIRATSG